MPELPEVEHLRRSLLPGLLGARVCRVELRRPAVLDRHTRGCPGSPGPSVHHRRGLHRALLRGRTIRSLERRGKQLAISTGDGPALCVHLGMTGQLLLVQPGARLPVTSHVHCLWWLRRNEQPAGRLVFRDPRRFGGIWTFDRMPALRRARWSGLGPDALTIRARQLAAALSSSNRPIKALLLDQRAIAGLGNIYADESLFRARIHPASTATAIPDSQVRVLASSIRCILRRAIDAGGSTIRDYADAHASPGWFHLAHQVYGRWGEPCLRCHHPLARISLAGRTTVACERCQRRCAG